MAGEFNGILQLEAGRQSGVRQHHPEEHLRPTGRSPSPATSSGRTRPTPTWPFGSTTTTNVIQLGRQLDHRHPDPAGDAHRRRRRIIVQGAGTVILGADNTQGYTAASNGQGTYVGLQGGWTLNNGAILRVAGNNNLGIGPAAVTANYFQMATAPCGRTELHPGRYRGITLADGRPVRDAPRRGRRHRPDLRRLHRRGRRLLQGGGRRPVPVAVHTYTGDTTVSGGLLRTTGAGRLPTAPSSRWKAAPATILDVTNIIPTFGGLGGGNGGAGSEVQVGAQPDHRHGRERPVRLPGVITGAADVRPVWSSSAAAPSPWPAPRPTPAGWTTVNGGVLQLATAPTPAPSSAASSPRRGNVAFSAGATPQTFSEAISGSGSLTKMGVGS